MGETATKIYPTAADAEGWYYENEDDEGAGILTKMYDNESRVKKVELSKNRTAIIRELRGRDFNVIQDIIGGESRISMEAATMSLSVKINDEGYPPEFFMDDLKLSDFSKLLIPVGRLNFS